MKRSASPAAAKEPNMISEAPRAIRFCWFVRCPNRETAPKKIENGTRPARMRAPATVLITSPFSAGSLMYRNAPKAPGLPSYVRRWLCLQ